MTLYEKITLACGAITAVGTPISIYGAFLNRRGNQIQKEQAGEFHEQTEIMRADAMGTTVPPRLHNPAASVSTQLSWLRKRGALPYIALSIIFAVASSGLFYAYFFGQSASAEGRSVVYVTVIVTPASMPTPIREIVYVTPAPPIPTPVPMLPIPHVLSVEQVLALNDVFSATKQQIDGADDAVRDKWVRSQPTPDNSPQARLYIHHWQMNPGPNLWRCTIVLDDSSGSGEFLNQIMMIALNAGCNAQQAVHGQPAPTPADVDAVPQPTPTAEPFISIATTPVDNAEISTAINNAADGIRNVFARPPFSIHARRIEPSLYLQKAGVHGTIYIDLNNQSPWSSSR
jgi:hypothetical protein